MRVFAVYSPRKAWLVRVWAESWDARGWSAKLLTEREVRERGTPRRAAKARGGGLLTDLCVINFSCRARSRDPRKSIRFGKPGWERAGLVRFSVSETEQQIRDCGRPL
jgi:hypothetical protein